jgi:predicted site-specific integrase-resolvase
MSPGAGGELLTTAQMAERLGIKPKTLLRHKSNGAVRPALQRGKLIRWKGDEVVR